MAAPREPSTSDRLLEVAAGLFREKGYAATTTRELAEALGIQKASLYHHIDNKEQLLFDICMESLRRITAAVAEASATTEPEKRLEAVVERHLQSALTDRDLHTTMLVELRALSPEHGALVREQRDRYEHLLHAIVADEQREGRLRSDVDARWLTKALLNLLNWTIFWFDPDGALAPSAFAGILTAVFLDGARHGSRAALPIP